MDWKLSLFDVPGSSWFVVIGLGLMVVALVGHGARLLIVRRRVIAARAAAARAVAAGAVGSTAPVLDPAPVRAS